MTLFDQIVHGLRMQGWSRIDAESEALERVSRASVDRNPEGEKPQALSAKHENAVTNEVRQTPGSSSNHSIEIEE